MTDPAFDPRAATPGRPLLLRGGTVVSMDPATGVLPRGDVLVIGNRIAAIGHAVDAPDDALVLDAADRIVMPGLIDAHRHTWEAVVRGLGADWSLVDYFKRMPTDFGPHFTPDDIYAATLLAATECLEEGVTAFGDWSDNAGRSPDHADAAARGMEDAGIRGRLHYANLFAPAHEWGTSPDVERMWARHSDREARVSMQMGIDSTRDPAMPELAALRFAKDRGIPVATHAAAFGWDHEAWIGKLHAHGLMGPDYTYIHAVAAPAPFLQLIRDTGGAVTMASCSNCNYGQGFPDTAGLRARGIPVGLGSDNEMRGRLSIFELMHGALLTDHLHQHLDAHREGHVAPVLELRSETVVEMATIGGARALGLHDVTGSLTVGKQADIIVVAPHERAMPLRFGPWAHIVHHARREQVETVLVAGRVVKHGGTLLHHRAEDVTRIARTSRDALIERIGEDALMHAATHPATDAAAPPPPTL